MAKIISTPAHRPKDWLDLEPVSVNAGALAREQEYLRLLLDKTRGEVPVIFTVFSPLTTAYKLCPDLMRHVAEGFGEEVKAGLRVITESTCALVQRVIEMGADGIFFATQLSSYAAGEEIFTASTVCLMIWRCFLHHQGGAMCSTLTGKTSCFPCSGNIRCRFSTGMPGNPCLKSVRRRRLRGNVSWQGWSGWISPAAERMRSNTAFIKRSGRQGGRKIILSPGCVIRYPLNEEILAFVRKAKK